MQAPSSRKMLWLLPNHEYSAIFAFSKSINKKSHFRFSLFSDSLPWFHHILFRNFLPGFQFFAHFGRRTGGWDSLGENKYKCIKNQKVYKVLLLSKLVEFSFTDLLLETFLGWSITSPSRSLSTGASLLLACASKFARASQRHLSCPERCGAASRGTWIVAFFTLNGVTNIILKYHIWI